MIIDDNLPAAFSSVCSWVLIGPVSDVDVPTYHSMPVSLTVSIEGLMEKFWHAEEPVAAPDGFTVKGDVSLFSLMNTCAYRQAGSRYRYRFVHQYAMMCSPGHATPPYDALNR